MNKTDVDSPPGFPIDGKFETIEQINAYFANDHLLCLLCGRSMQSLPRHLRHAHAMSADDYKARYGLPWDRGLIGIQVRAKLKAALEAQPRRPLPVAPVRSRHKPLQPYERDWARRVIVAYIQKRTDTDEAHAEFLRRIQSGRTIRDVAKDQDMPNLQLHYAYRKRKAGFDRRARQAVRANMVGGRKT